MAIERCDYCDQNIDLDTDVEHWSEEEYAKGRDHWKCKWEIEDDIQFRAEGQIKAKKIERLIGGDLSQNTFDPDKHRWGG